MWTLVGAGAKTLEDSCRPMVSLIPPQAKWLQTSVTHFLPDQNTIVLEDGRRLGYEYLVVALGLQVNFKNVCEELKCNYICISLRISLSH